MTVIKGTEEDLEEILKRVAEECDCDECDECDDCDDDDDSDDIDDIFGFLRGKK